MLYLALILLICTLLLFIFGLASGTSTAFLKFWFLTFNVQVSTVFFLGMFTAFLLVITLWTFRLSFRRRRERRRKDRVQSAAGLGSDSAE